MTGEYHAGDDHGDGDFSDDSLDNTGDGSGDGCVVYGQGNDGVFRIVQHNIEEY
jgi:hypothetical protein